MTETKVEERTEYERSIHSNPDARAWAKYYCRIFPNADYETALSWFANAMMAMHNHLLTHTGGEMTIRIFVILGTGREMYACSWSGVKKNALIDHCRHMFAMEHENYDGPTKELWVRADVQPPQIGEVVKGDVEKGQPDAK